MDKEKVSKDINIRIHPSLFRKLKSKCDEQYKTISEVVRGLIVDFVQNNKNDNMDRK